MEMDWYLSISTPLIAFGGGMAVATTVHYVSDLARTFMERRAESKLKYIGE